MSNRNPDARYEDAPQAIRFAIEQTIRAQVHTSVPGIVRSYDPATKRARVQPALRLLVAEGDTVTGHDKPPILDVPVQQRATGGWMIHQQLDEGDTVLLLFSERGVEQFKAAWGQVVDPARGTFFAERDAFAIPWGVEDIAPVSDSGVVIQNADGTVYVQLDGTTIRRVTGSTEVVETPSGITINTPGAVAITSASLTHNGVNVGDTHRHRDVSVGTGVTGLPQ